MGYRSKVLIVLSHDACTQATKDDSEAFDRCFGDCTAISPDRDLLYTIDSHSWNDIDDPYVIRIMKYLSKLDDGLFLFQRAGECREDFNQMGEYVNNPFEASIEVKIVWKPAITHAPSRSLEEDDTESELRDKLQLLTKSDLISKMRELGFVAGANVYALTRKEIVDIIVTKLYKTHPKCNKELSHE